MDPTVARIMSLLKSVQDSGLGFVEYVKVKRAELEDLTDELQELENLLVAPKEKNVLMF